MLSSALGGCAKARCVISRYHLMEKISVASPLSRKHAQYKGVRLFFLPDHSTSEALEHITTGSSPLSIPLHCTPHNGREV